MDARDILARAATSLSLKFEAVFNSCSAAVLSPACMYAMPLRYRAILPGETVEYLSAMAWNCFCAAFARSAIVENVGPASSAGGGEPAGRICASRVRMAADSWVL